MYIQSLLQAGGCLNRLPKYVSNTTSKKLKVLSCRRNTWLRHWYSF